MTKLWDAITAAGQKRPYGMTESQELDGKVPEGSVSVKCSDDIFLVKTAEGLKVYCSEDGTLADPGYFVQTTETDGFRTEISLAPDVILPAELSGETFRLGETELPVSVRKVREKMLLLCFEEGEAVLFDVSRFLLYAFTGGEFICGYVEV